MIDVEFRSPEQEELPGILSLLNEEFIFRKGRKLPLEVRFPALFSTDNRDHCFGMFNSQRELLSFAAAEPRLLQLSGKEYRVFTVGAVFTPEEFRGKGYAGRVLTHLAEYFRLRGFAAGYLWTGLHQFYEKLGWRTCDGSQILVISEEIPASPVKIVPLTIEDARHLAHAYSGTLRRTASGVEYFKIPPPADIGIQLVSEADGGYLCGGCQGQIGYVYELCGKSAATLQALLATFQRQGNVKSIWVNLRPDMAEIALLKGMFPHAEAKKVDLQMNLVFEGRLESVLSEITIPFLDRI